MAPTAMRLQTMVKSMYAELMPMPNQFTQRRRALSRRMNRTMPTQIMKGTV